MDSTDPSALIIPAPGSPSAGGRSAGPRSRPGTWLRQVSRATIYSGPRCRPSGRRARTPTCSPRSGPRATGKFEALFGPLDWRPTRGTWRLAAPGFVLVAGTRWSGSRTSWRSGHRAPRASSWSGPPRSSGTGTALVAAARARAADAGTTSSRCAPTPTSRGTAPFYRLLGFEGLTDLSPVHRAMREGGAARTDGARPAGRHARPRT